MRIVLETQSGGVTLPAGFVEVWPDVEKLNFEDPTLVDALIVEIQECVERERGRTE